MATINEGDTLLCLCDSIMGICPGFFRLLRHDLLDKNMDFPVRVMNPKNVLEDTTILFVDFTQLLFIGKTGGTGTIVRTYEDINSFLTSTEPIGEITISNNQISNKLNVFSKDFALNMLMERISHLSYKWKYLCNLNKVRCNLHTVYLVLDGDSPVAKNETKKMRMARNDMHYIFKKLESIGVDVVANTERLKQRCYGTQPVDQRQVMASLKRYMIQRDYRSDLIKQLIKKLRDNQCANDVNLVLVKGIDTSNLLSVTQIWGNSHIANLSGTIPYLEADHIIPYVWAKIQHRKERACIITADSDMLLTLLALQDERLCLWSNSCLDGIDTQNNGKVLVSCKKHLLSPNVLLNLLLHLTMGGCDYAENIPQCGPVRLMNGCHEILSEKHDYFTNIKLATLEDLGFGDKEDGSELFQIEHSTISEKNETWLDVKEVVMKEKNMFPIRLGSHMYLIILKDTDAKEIMSRYNGIGRVKCFTDFSSKQCERFFWSMKRRLFFLSLVTETRMGLETLMVDDVGIAQKCGFSYGDFLFLNKL